ncbi:LacI family transcriptional regulator [Pedobacter frigiditerrae]|uniref:LacI family transcriptional regulator n=1 Tax=Pedobacter frigiditerrae TaxID=2530452 RepID=A0A4V2MIU8_9SPHI|nr:LacI family DNA-binding transcriptional regulator [Pedobacter frigiditerrae]TCC91746.1 LacI family transcriptional regulator [Pedobacter frigiditerrae]
MNKTKRITIYDLAKELGISGSYVSRALNDHPTTSEKMREMVKQKAKELNYKHNTSAANLRQGNSKIIGIIVPKINETFFANVIAGIEEICSKYKYHIIICQSEENLKKEKEAIDTLIKQNVDCIMISLSQETKTNAHLLDILANKIHLIQFDRVDESVESYIIKNDNKIAAFNGVEHLIKMGYERIAHIGGPVYLNIYADRKQGYREALLKAKHTLFDDEIDNIALSRTDAKTIALKLLSKQDRPDAFFTSSDQAALGVIQAAKELNISIPKDLGVLGFQDEEFSSFISPNLSSINQQSKQIGISAANLFFKTILKNKVKTTESSTEIINCELMIRESSYRKIAKKFTKTPE